MEVISMIITERQRICLLSKQIVIIYDHQKDDKKNSE